MTQHAMCTTDKTVRQTTVLTWGGGLGRRCRNASEPLFSAHAKKAFHPCQLFELRRLCTRMCTCTSTLPIIMPYSTSHCLPYLVLRHTISHRDNYNIHRIGSHCPSDPRLGSVRRRPTFAKASLRRRSAFFAGRRAVRYRLRPLYKEPPSDIVLRQSTRRQTAWLHVSMYHNRISKHNVSHYIMTCHYAVHQFCRGIKGAD